MFEECRHCLTQFDSAYSALSASGRCGVPRSMLRQLYRLGFRSLGGHRGFRSGAFGVLLSFQDWEQQYSVEHARLMRSMPNLFFIPLRTFSGSSKFHPSVPYRGGCQSPEAASAGWRGARAARAPLRRRYTGQRVGAPARTRQWRAAQRPRSPDHRGVGLVACASGGAINSTAGVHVSAGLGIDSLLCTMPQGQPVRNNFDAAVVGFRALAFQHRVPSGSVVALFAEASGRVARCGEGQHGLGRGLQCTD